MSRNCPRRRAVDEGLARFAPWLVSLASSAHQSLKFQPRALEMVFIRSAPLPDAEPPEKPDSDPFANDASNAALTLELAAERMRSSAPCPASNATDGGP